MSRSNYKKPLLLTDDLFYFYSHVNPEFYHYLRSQRNKTINTITCNSSFFIYQGNSYCDIRVTPFSVGKKLGMFSKTRKPFFLDQKKKKDKHKLLITWFSNILLTPKYKFLIIVGSYNVAGEET